MTGTITQRGDQTWLLRWYDYEVVQVDGQPRRLRKQRYKIVHGSKREATGVLAEITASKRKAEYVAPNKVTVAQAADDWLNNDATSTRTKTRDRYKGIVEKQIKPGIGALLVREVSELTLEDFYRRLATSGRDDGKGLSPRTIQHVHRVMHAILKRAVKARLVSANVASSAQAPKGPGDTAEAFDETEFPAVLAAFRGRPLYPVVSLAFDTGLRRGELLALRWSDIDLVNATLIVDESLSQASDGRTFEAPKTRTSRRTITLTTSTVAELTAYRKEQLEQRVALGLGKLPDNALLFPGDDGGARDPDAVTRGFARVVAKLPVRQLSFHATRHTHASRLIAAGIDIVTISRRLGHANPSITLKVYAHLFNRRSDAKAAQAIDAALAR